MALKITRIVGAKRGEESWLGSLGNTYAKLGDYEIATEYLRRAIQIARKIKHRQSEGYWLNNLGSVFAYQGRLTEALACYILARQMNAEIDNNYQNSVTRQNLSSIESEMGFDEFIALEHSIAPKAEEIVDKELEKKGPSID